MKNLVTIAVCAIVLHLIKCDRLEEVTVHLELLEMDMDDYCSNISASSRNAFLKVPNAYKDKLNSQKKFGNFSKRESKDLREFYVIDGLDLNIDSKQRWNILAKMGDMELPEEDWIMLSKFKNDNEQISEELQIPCSKIPCAEIPCGRNESKECRYSRTDIMKMLSTSHDANILRAFWSSSGEEFDVNSKQYSAALKLVKKAADINEFDNPESYWSTLVDYPDAYSKMKSLWEEIEPLYKKIFDFVRLRLEQVYRIPSNESLPVYLLGSKDGIDWSFIADKILPHRYLYDEIISTMVHEEINGKKAYEMAEKLTVSMGFKKNNQEFWQKSYFNETCPSHLLTYCADKYSQVITCNKTTWTDYLNAHEDMVHISLDSLDYTTATYKMFRMSIVDESLAKLSTVLAIKNLPMMGLIPEEAILADEAGQNENQMTALLLTALRVLPRLPYYLLADTWRLNNLEDDSQDLVASWWEQREKIQFVRGVTNKEWDMLADDYIRSNKPYVGKFLATVLMFQFLDYFENNGDDSINLMSRISNDDSFKFLLKNRIKDDWMMILNDQFNIYDIEADALLEYFHPLEEYLENAPEKQVVQTVRPKTTSTTTTTTTTESPKITEDHRPVADAPRTDEEVNKADLINIPKNYKKTETTVPVFDGKNVVVNDVNTSSRGTTEVWIGALVGIAALLVIGGIIGSRKCRRRPTTNNRRFEA